MGYLTEKDHSNSSLIYCIVCIDVLLLFVSKYIFIGLGIIVVLLFYVFFNKKDIDCLKECVFFAIFLLINLIQFFFIQDNEVLRETARLVIYFLLATLLYNIRVSYSSFITIWRVMLSFCFTIQLIQFFNIFNINAILEKIYGESIFLKVAGYSSITNFRSGSIFVAINPYFKFTAISLALFLFNLEKNDRNHYLDYFFIAVSFLSSFLCGSRTGFITLLVICGVYFFSKFGKYINIKAILKFFLVSIFFIIFFLLLNENFNFQEARLFSAEDSLGYKIKVIKLFLERSTPSEFLFGMGAYDVKITRKLDMDSDIGYTLSYYGLLGVIIYYLMIIRLTYFKHVLDKNERIYLFMILIIVFLGGFTSGIFFNYRVFATIMLALIPFYTARIKDRQLTKI